MKNIYYEKYIMTETELRFWHRLKKLIGNKYIITPQVALSSIIEKSTYGYANELFRTLDFGIFTKRNYKLLALIELNDKSHFNDDRWERDQKVKEILEEAGLREILITFWTHMPNEDEYILERINQIIY